MNDSDQKGKAMSEQAKPLRVALLGAGTVGSQVARLLLEHGAELAERVGWPVELVGVAVRRKELARPGIPAELITFDALELVGRDDVDIVVELMGGIEPARTIMLTAIENGHSVVTGNKALLSNFGAQIYDAAQARGVDVYFEAAVAGAIPIVRPLRESLVGDLVLGVTGIVNGTTNFILDKMTTEGLGYQQALAQAQELGYAEADPTADVEGHDAAAKAAILASLAFHTRLSFADVYCEGMTNLTSEDIDAARELGCVIKMLAVAKRSDGHISVRVHPAMVPLAHPLATVSGANNAIFVEAREAGQLMFQGPGAGGAPTASAVVGDLVTVARNRVRGIALPVQTSHRLLALAPMGELHTRYYLRMQVHDRPGVLAQAAAMLAKHHISVQTVHQSAGDATSGSVAQLGMTTHVALEADMAACVADLTAADFTIGGVCRIRVEGC